MLKTFTPADLKNVCYLSSPSLSPDATTAAYVRTVATPADGGYEAQVVLTQLSDGSTRKIDAKGHTKAPVYTRDGAFIYLLCDESGEYQVCRYEVSSGAMAQLTTLRHGVVNFSLSPDDSRAVFEANIWPQEVADGKAFEQMNAEQKQQWLRERDLAPQVITQIDYKRDETYGVRDGSLAYLGVVDAAGKQTLITSGKPFHQPAFSPDGKRIACYGQPYTGASYSSQELFILNDDGGSLLQLTKECGLAAEAAPCFTQDGSSIIFCGYCMENGMVEFLYKVPACGGEVVCLFDVQAQEVSSGVYGLPGSRTQYGDESPCFMVCGDWAYFHGAWNGAARLFRISLEGQGVPEVVLSDDNFSVHAFCAPNGDDVLLMGGSYHIIRELYVYNTASKQLRRVCDSNPWLAQYNLAKVYKEVLPSKDGKTSIHTWTVLPVGYEKGKRYPTVLYVHGGPSSCFTADFWHEFQSLAGAGFAVVYCDPRGSFGYGREFCSMEAAWGDEAYDDLMLAIDHAIEQGIADPGRTGITGGSYGGYMTCKIIMNTTRFAASVAQRTFVNKATSYGTGDMGFYSRGTADRSKLHIENMLVDRARTSIICGVDNIKTPLLLLHGYRDYRCSFEQAEQMFIAVKQRCKGVPVRLVMYPGENHGVTRVGKLHWQISHLSELIGWFEKYLKEGTAHD